MGLSDVDPTLPTNTLIFELRRDSDRLAEFRENPQRIMQQYGLSESERSALMALDLKAMAQLGVHPFFLPQVSRLFTQGGWGYTDNQSESSRVVAEKLGLKVG